MSEVHLSIPADSLLKLPQGASYNAKSGRANVRVSKGSEQDIIYVYASCDSLQRLVEYYEAVDRHNQGRIDELQNKLTQTESKRSSNHLRTVLYAFIAGLALGLILKMIIKKIFKK
mgnify:CR=1 FL=1